MTPEERLAEARACWLELESALVARGGLRPKSILNRLNCAVLRMRKTLLGSLAAPRKPC